MSDANRKTLEEIHNYWKKRSLPELYVTQVKRSEFLFGYIKDYIKKSGKILEIGCNAGRNLNYIYEKGYEDLTGIEISKEAVDALKRTYPLLKENAEIIHCPVENIIKDIPTNYFDLVFTMALLEHIHPDSEWIFEEIARISSSYIITIEAEKSEHWRIFPRNYKEIFEKYGFLQVEEGGCYKGLGLDNYTIRVMKKLLS